MWLFARLSYLAVSKTEYFIIFCIMGHKQQGIYGTWQSLEVMTISELNLMKEIWKGMLCLKPVPPQEDEQRALCRAASHRAVERPARTGESILGLVLCLM